MAEFFAMDPIRMGTYLPTATTYLLLPLSVE